MGFAEQLLLNELAGSGLFVVLLVAICYSFYLHLKGTIQSLEDDKKEIGLRIVDICSQMSNLNNQVAMLANNMNNYMQNVGEVEKEVTRAYQEFSKETSRVVDEVIRLENQLRGYCESVQIQKDINQNTGGQI